MIGSDNINDNDNSDDVLPLTTIIDTSLATSTIQSSALQTYPQLQTLLVRHEETEQQQRHVPVERYSSRYVTVANGQCRSDRTSAGLGGHHGNESSHPRLVAIETRSGLFATVPGNGGYRERILATDTSVA
ncbi:hypothetical protein IV203_024646 [Nitzschia inconspicua]|uniref:Uncharacterized protein n=1 Tax=Nitzschia inconspicua TaxID=303405 RepID=A0A9K3K5I7_9STRA|nr:hypothetical protein IV203_024646 [Nitzschia inconspicua]